MNRKNMLYIAAFFTLFTFVGHSFGTLMPQQNVPETIAQAQSVMEGAIVEMPFGPPRSLARMYYGGNVMISLYLFVTGIFLILSAKPERFVPALVLLNGLGLAACAIFSFVFYFPLPGICTGLAAALGMMAAKAGR